MMKNRKRLHLFAAAFMSIALLSACQKNKPTEPTEADLVPFTPPTGFEWEGSYLDRVNDLAVLTIEKDGSAYYCTISVPDQAITHIESYEFKAAPAGDGLGLSYTDGVRTSYLLPSADKPDAGVSTQEVYKDGTGRIYYLDGEVYWMDEKDNAGNTFIFEKVEAESEVSDNAVN
ncbi:MAG: hypothetical protein J6X66_06035 [Lachnospiraceae bacterium]|nr:hypothetical protein [Lachnospiraceae bacterium]